MKQKIFDGGNLKIWRIKFNNELPSFDGDFKVELNGKDITGNISKLVITMNAGEEIKVDIQYYPTYKILLRKIRRLFK